MEETASLEERAAAEAAARRAEGQSATDDLRRRLLEAMLPHVPFDGWSNAALRAAARDIEVSAALARDAFPGGLAETAAFFSAEADRTMLEALEARTLGEMRVRDRVATAIRLRLEQATPHREAIRRALGLLALPQNARIATASLYHTVDAIWYAAGDTATDYNFYTKRLLLAGVYSSTLLFWLNDRSEGFEETWAFLDRRLDQVLRVGGTFGKLVGRVLDAPDRLLGRIVRPPGARRTRARRRSRRL